METVADIDTAAREVRLERGDALRYDHLLLASGATHAYFGHDEWAAHAPGLKTLDDALHIRRRILSAFERAEAESDPAAKRALLTFAIVGGGPTGVERSEEHTSELQSLMRISYAVFCLKKKNHGKIIHKI